MTVADGQRIGGFRVVASIRCGKGSQGAVVKAVCERETVEGVAVGEVVALKVMSVRDEDGSAYASFARRTELLRALSHPNIVRYRGCFAESGPFSSQHVLVMEHLEGETLKERLASNPGGVDADEAVRIFLGVLAGLDAASRVGIVHRDVKPGNIFLCRDGGVKLIDFEIARKEGGTVSTASGRFAGTFDYMAPEFADPSFRGDARSDVFSAGVVFHEALTGVVPYTREKEKGEQADFAFLSRWSQRQEGLCAIRIRSTVKRLLAHADEVLKRALEEDPSKRYQTAAEFAEGVKAIRFRELRSPLHSYRLLRVIGRGGFGEVFKARIRGTREFVAVKHLLKSAYGDRFRREARVMRQLDDPAFVKFVDYFETQHAGGEEAFLVMAYLPGMPGMSLRDAIRGREKTPMPLRDVLSAFALYAHALATMHKRGIYHRDIKPANLYYPTGRPENAAIMDLGIARDVNGTATTGQVPGTLDYMPPEIVLGNSRGDAGMDIYALGLCLYESITGKTAYPRLPTGPTAFAAFYERARAKAPPIIEHPDVVSSPALLSLIRDMTAIDPVERLYSAETVFRCIKAICEDEALPSPSPPQPKPLLRTKPAGMRPVSVPRPVPVPQPRGDEPATMDTNPDVPRRSPLTCSRPRIPDSRFLFPPKAVAGMVVVAALAVGAVFAKTPLLRWYDGYKQSAAEKRQRQLAEEVELRRKEAEETERLRVQKVRDSAVAEADAVVGKFEGYADSATAAWNAAAEWVLKWRGNDDVAQVFAAQTNRFAKAEMVRKARDRREADDANRLKAERAASEVVSGYMGYSVSTADCNASAAAWNAAWKPLLGDDDYRRLSSKIAEALMWRRNRDAEEAGKIEDRKRKEKALADAEKTAREQANAIIRKLGDESESVAVVKAEYAIWQNEWGKYEKEGFFRECRDGIEKASAERTLVESSRAVEAECDRWLANIRSVTAENVRNWRTNLDRAELELKRALGEKRISEKRADAVRAKIAVCRKWAVGVIDNKTHRVVEFGGVQIQPVSSSAVVFTNGVPDGVAVTSEGCDPYRVKEGVFDSNVITVMPKSLVERSGGAKARVPVFGDGMVCLVDGVERRPGVIDVRPGRRHVVWRSLRETYPGTRDFKDQNIMFDAKKSETVDIPLPSDRWTPSAEFESAGRNAAELARGREIVDSIEKCLVPEPLETRRARLEKAHGILSDWRTSAALAVLGESVELDLQGRLSAEKARVRGYVRNDTDTSAVVKTDVSEVTVRSGERKMVTFENKWTGRAYAALPDYEFVFLPRLRDEFDGGEFVIEQAKLVPLPVKVTIPVLEEGVTCELAGKRITGETNVRPGVYSCAYSKPDCKTQKFEVTVRLGEDMTLPPPKVWEPSGAFSAFTEALGAFASGAANVTKDMVDKIGTIEDPAKRRELEELRKAVELRERLEQGK